MQTDNDVHGDADSELEINSSDFVDETLLSGFTG